MSWGAWILMLVYPALVATSCSACRTLLDRLPRLEPALQTAGRNARAGQVIGVVEHGAGWPARHLYRDPAQRPRRPPAVEQRAPRAALPRLGPLRGGGLRAHDRPRTSHERELLAKIDNEFLATELVDALPLPHRARHARPRSTCRPPASSSADPTRRPSGSSWSAWASCFRCHPVARGQPPGAPHAAGADPGHLGRPGPAFRHRLRRPDQPLAAALSDEDSLAFERLTTSRAPCRGHARADRTRRTLREPLPGRDRPGTGPAGRLRLHGARPGGLGRLHSSLAWLRQR